MEKSLAHSFEPIAGRDAEILILGSMPGRASLRAGQYYAHPRNAFWRIIAELLGIEPASDYPARIRALRAARIALWDVLESCARAGSSDSAIDADTITANDFRTFFRRHRGIGRVFFNGAKAESCYRQHVLPTVDAGAASYLRLPSTSPANTVPYAQKLRAWRAALALRPAPPGAGRSARRASYSETLPVRIR
jgi:hypoxanthine-DNA glycosylase